MNEESHPKSDTSSNQFITLDMSKLRKFQVSVNIIDLNMMGDSKPLSRLGSAELGRQLSRSSTGAFDRNITSMEVTQRQERKFINWKDDSGKTALHYAAIMQNKTMIQMLLNHGSLYYIKDSDNNDAEKLCSGDVVISNILARQREFYKNTLNMKIDPNDETPKDPGSVLQAHFDSLNDNFNPRDGDMYTAFPIKRADLEEIDGEELYKMRFGFYDTCAFGMILRNWDGSGKPSNLTFIT